jgi:LysR family transcriptional regulator, glycine cleavage system transcriptional activator
MYLPPLNALKAFEVASRSAFFKTAAVELGVTPGAVGRQIKLLEEHLGLELFVRKSSPVQLTRAGEIYAKKVRSCFAELEVASLELTRKKGRAPLRIWCSRTFMRQWLVPRLADFHQRFPEINVIFSTSDGLKAIDGGEVDLAIRLGDRSWADPMLTPLFTCRLVPVCSPAYLAKSPPLSAPADLANHTLLQSLRRRDDWLSWLRAAGLGQSVMRNTLSFEGESLAHQAAIEGVGIALGRTSLFEIDVRAGKLVTLFDNRSVDAAGQFFLVDTEKNRQKSHAVVFKRWLIEQVNGMSA